ncbi:MAG: diguanylate cyclase domain-containing protein [Candidatus Cryosericum sp.]
MIHPSDRHLVFQAIQSTMQGTPGEIGVDYRIIRLDGTERSVSLMGETVLDSSGAVRGLRGTMQDITARKKVEDALADERLLLRTLIYNIPDSTYSKDRTCHKTLANLAEAHNMGAAAEADILGKDDFSVYPRELAEKFFADDQLVLQTGEPILNREEYVVDERGTERWLLTSKLPLRNREGQITGLVGIGRDITERRKMEQELAQTATHDSLTGLPNRRLLLDRFTIAAALARRSKARIAVMLFDLDKFKTVNDTFGHDAGDQVLKAAGIRVASTLRASDTLARIGGDEFMVVMMETGKSGGVTAMARKILDSFAKPLSVGGHRIQLTASIGVAMYPEDGEDLETLTRKSDVAMYCSKNRGGNQSILYKQGDAQVG